MKDIDTSVLSIAHIVGENPIIYDGISVKKEYVKCLHRLIAAGGWKRRKFVRAGLDAYGKIIYEQDSSNEEHDISYYKYFILCDVYHILGYEFKRSDIPKLEKFKEKYFRDFTDTDKKLSESIIRAFIYKDITKLKQLADKQEFFNERLYFQLILKNLQFKKRTPTTVMVTATMSAGKSTFINALAGKYICLSQNMACTSKMHCIVNKAFEDGVAYEYDHDLVLMAGKEELLNNNELNNSDRITVGVRFDGRLCDERIIVTDSPGVNYSQNQEHKMLTEKLIRRKNYDLLVYLMNATQLGTNDESDHLDFVKKAMGRGKIPVLFVINKIDSLNVEEENAEAVIGRQIEYLKKKGFKNPLVCPVSSKAGYLSKRFASGELSRSEKRELYNLVDKFEQMNLQKYYARDFSKVIVLDSDSEEEQLLKTSGLAYVEEIIRKITQGVKVNGTDLR